ncbi:MAG: DUF4013 domain-containing protein [Gemmataceae bacterium]
MKYWLAFTFAWNKPKSGKMNILMMTLMLFIPIVGPIVLLGYRNTVAEDLDDDPETKYHRDFKFEKFTDYLTRGVYQFVMQFVMQVVIGGGFYIVLLGGMMTAQSQKWSPELLLIFVGICYLLFFLVILITTMFMWPMEMYASLNRKFQLGEGIRFTKTYLRTMWKETFLAIIVYMILSMVVVLIGALLCCVGMYPALSIMMMANGHILVQLYKSYVNQGGEPLRYRDELDGADEPFDDDDGV